MSVTATSTSASRETAGSYHKARRRPGQEKAPAKHPSRSGTPTQRLMEAEHGESPLIKAFTIAANYFVTRRSDLLMSATWKIPSKYVTLIELAGNSSSNDELPEGFGEG